MKFNKGDIVKPQLGGVQMTVDGYINNNFKKEYIRVVCVWIEDGKECLGQFTENALVLVKGFVQKS